MYLIRYTTLILAFSAGAATVAGETVGGSIPRQLTLAAAEELLLRRNLAVAAERFRVDANRAAGLIARYKPNPILTVSAEQFATLPPYGSLSRSPRLQFTRTDLDAAALPGYSVGVEKLIERGGKRELRADHADARLQAAEAELLDAVRGQLFELRRAFVEARLARENLVLARQTLREHQRIQSLTQVRVEIGETAAAELHRVRAGELEHQRDVLQGGIELETAAREILRVLGARPEEVETPPARVVAASAGGTALAETAPASPQGLPLDILGDFVDQEIHLPLSELRQMALDSRPDVLAARHRLHAAGALRDLGRAMRVRDVSVGAAFERIGSDNTFGLSFQIPLFVHHRHEAEARETLAEYRTAELEVRRAELEALTEVEKTYQQYAMAREILDLYDRRNLEQVQRLLEIAVFTYREGASSMLELLDAQRAYNQTLAAYNQVRAGYELSLHALEHAVGAPLISSRRNP
jgi:outer membrane protein, heavy metal efflux system